MVDKPADALRRATERAQAAQAAAKAVGAELAAKADAERAATVATQQGRAT